MTSPDLSLIMPVYNEAHLLHDSLADLLQALEELGLSFELLVVNDGSTDGSGLLLAGFARKDARLKVIELERNEGKGAALQRGVLTAKGRHILTMDADLSTHLEALPRALQALHDGSAIVIGDRRHPQSLILIRQAPGREFLGRLFSHTAQLLVNPAIRDFTCGFKAYRRDAARELFENLEIARWAYDVELLAIARSRGFKVEALPVQWAHHPDTRVRFPVDAWRALLDLLRVFFRLRSRSYRA